MMNRRLLLCITLIIPFIARAEIAVTDIKGMYNDIIDGKKHLSPVHGLNWYKTGIIENMYRFGDEKQASIKLIKEMFHLEPDGVTFNITRIEGNTAFYFTSKTIGKILNYIENNVNIDTEQLRRIIAEDIGYVGDKIAELNKNLESNRRQQERLKNIADLGEIAKKEQDLALKKLEIEKQIEQLKQESLCPKVESKQFNKVMNFLSDCCKEVKNSKDNFYVLHNILLSFMWKKADSKEEFFDYCAQFTPGILQSSVSADEWRTSAYSKNDYEKFKKSLEKDAATVLQDYELSSFGSCMAQEWGEIYSPIIGGSTATYAAKDGSYSFSDCGETSLRNFFDIVLYDIKTKEFDISYLQNKKGITLSKALESYYITYNNVAKISTKSYRDGWAQVVSGLPNVEYATNQVCNITGNDITPRLNNVLKIFNHLLFGNSADFDALSTQEKLNYLTESVSRDGFIVTWSLVEGELDKNVLTELEFLVETERLNYKFYWIFDVGHFVISKIGSKDLDIQSDVTEQLIETFVPQFYLLGWYKNVNDLEDIVDIQKLKLAIYMQNLLNSDVARRTVEILLEKRIIDESLIIKLCKSLPSDEFAFQRIINILPQEPKYEKFVDAFIVQLMINKPILQLIVSKKKELLYKYITQNNINKLNNGSLSNLMRSILSDKIKQLYWVIESNVGRLDFNSLRPVVFLIIRKKVHELYSIIPLNYVISDLNSDSSGNLMILIIEAKLEQFYKHITQDNIDKLDDSALGVLMNMIVAGKVDNLYRIIVLKNVNRLNYVHFNNLIYWIVHGKVNKLYDVITQETLSKLRSSDCGRVMQLIFDNNDSLYQKFIENLSQ